MSHACQEGKHRKKRSLGGGEQPTNRWRQRCKFHERYTWALRKSRLEDQVIKVITEERGRWGDSEP